MKKGLAVVTYNSENYFKDLYDSIPFGALDEIVVINGGNPYEGAYDKVHWIQHTENKFPAQCRNEGLEYLMKKDCDALFICEDDMIFKKDTVFDSYVDAYKKTGLEYFCFASYAWETGPAGSRTPRLKVQYSEDFALNFYKHTCNEFTFRTRNMIVNSGIYDTNFRYLFDIDSIYRMAATKLCTPFWYFPDLANSDDLIMNNPVSASRLDEGGSRASKLGPDMERFIKIHGYHPSVVPETSQEDVIQLLKILKHV